MRSPISLSMICASRAVPRVAVTQRLRFTTGEQQNSEYVAVRQHAHVQTTDHVFSFAIDTRLASQYAATNNVFLIAEFRSAR